MSKESGKVVYPACFSQEESYYSIYFPDFEVTGKGFQGLDESIEFASNMLGEIVIDYISKGKELPKQSENVKGKKNSIYKYITIDADSYDFKAKRNGERMFFVQEGLQPADTSRETKPSKKAAMSLSRNKYIAIALAAVLCLTAVFVLSEISEKREKAKKEAEVALFDEYLQQARDDIKQELYDKAQEDIAKAYELDALEYDYRNAERESLYYYAQLLSLRSNGSPVDDQYELLDSINFSKEDEFYDDYVSVKSIVEKEYQHKQLIEDIKASSKERNRREELASKLPYVGMDEKDISSTIVGAYSVKNYNLIFRPSGFEGCDTIYDWDTSLPKETSSIVTLKVGVDDGVVIAVRKDMELWAWDGDKPLFLEDVMSAKKEDLKFDRNDPYNVYDYLTGVDFANNYKDAFLESLIKEYKNSGQFSPDELKDPDFANLAWNKAFDYWLEKQIYMEDDEEAAQEAIEEIFNNSEN